MNALQQFKQKGRILRKFLAQAINTEVKLSHAYEAIAAMEGASDWNEFSAKLVPSKAPAKATEPVTQQLPSIRAIFRTVDGKGVAEFDAAPWFAQASEEHVKALMEEKPRMAPIGYELSYGGMGRVSDGVAEFCASSSKELQNVYAYIQGLTAVGHDCGGSDCYIDAHDVQRWYGARADASKRAANTSLSGGAAGSVTVVLDTQVGQPENAELLRKVCHAAWEHAVDDWKQSLSRGGRCGYIIESTNVFNALSDYHIVSTGEEGYSAEVEQLVENALEDLGYHRQARYAYEGIAKLDEPFLGFVLFSSMNDGDEFLLLDSRELCRKVGVHRAATCIYPFETRFFDNDFEVQLVSKATKEFCVHEFLRKGEAMHHAAYEKLVAEEFGAKATSLAPAYSAKGLFNTLKVIEVNLVDVLNEYDVPEDCAEWGWVEKHHSFKHKDNGGEPGVWEFMVNVEKMAFVTDIPETLRPYFETAKKEGAAWVMFHQG
jgi:hypothetical protein